MTVYRVRNVAVVKVDRNTFRKAASAIFDRFGRNVLQAFAVVVSDDLEDFPLDGGSDDVATDGGGGDDDDTSNATATEGISMTDLDADEEEPPVDA